MISKLNIPHYEITVIKKNMFVEYGWKNKLMEQIKSTSTHVSSIAFWQGHQANSIEKEEYFQNLVLYLLNIHMEKKILRHLHQVWHKNIYKMK